MIGLLSLVSRARDRAARRLRSLAVGRGLSHGQVYAPIIGRIFEAQPLFMPLRVSPCEQGESVEFTTEDGLRALRAVISGRGPTSRPA